MVIHRYSASQVITTALDPFDDVIEWIKGFRSVDYLTEVIRRRHPKVGAVAPPVEERIAAAASHISTALDYVAQAREGPESVAFLPLYYAFLDLAKVYILLGPLADRLPAERTHGVSYDPTGNHGDLLDETINIWDQGAIPLFYRTVTNLPMPRGPVTLADVYPYILSIGAEYEMASGRGVRRQPVYIEITRAGGQDVVRCHLLTNDRPVEGMNALQDLPILDGFTQDPSEPAAFSSGPLAGNAASDVDAVLRRYLIHTVGPIDDYYDVTPIYTPIGPITWLPFEEMPILLAFFHLGSVARYNPEYLQGMARSKYWPMLLVLRRQATFRFLCLFWNFMMQESYYLVRR